MVFLIILGLFPLYLVHKTPWIPCRSFIVLPLTPASPLEILGMGLSVKGRRMKDSPLSFPLPGRKHSLDDVGEFLPKKKQFQEFGFPLGVPGHGFASGMVQGARGRSRNGKSVSAARSSAWGDPCGNPCGNGASRLPTQHPINPGSTRVPILAGIIVCLAVSCSFLPHQILPREGMDPTPKPAAGPGWAPSSSAVFPLPAWNPKGASQKFPGGIFGHPCKC